MKIEQKRQSIILRVIKRLSYRNLKIGDKFKEKETLIAQVINIRKEKYGTWIYYKMIDDYSLNYFGNHLKNEFSFAIGSEHYRRAVLNVL